MAKLVEMYCGVLQSAADRNGEEYQDWRLEYIGASGIICAYASQKLARGKYMIKFFVVSSVDEITKEACSFW